MAYMCTSFHFFILHAFSTYAKQIHTYDCWLTEPVGNQSYHIGCTVMHNEEAFVEPHH